MYMYIICDITQHTGVQPSLGRNSRPERVMKTWRNIGKKLFEKLWIQEEHRDEHDTSLFKRERIIFEARKFNSKYQKFNEGDLRELVRVHAGKEHEMDDPIDVSTFKPTRNTAKRRTKVVIDLHADKKLRVVEEKQGDVDDEMVAQRAKKHPTEWTNEEVLEWLKTIGLGSHASRFKSQEALHRTYSYG